MLNRSVHDIRGSQKDVLGRKVLCVTESNITLQRQERTVRRQTRATLQEPPAGHTCFLKFLKIFFFCAYLFLRERDRMQTGEGQREWETESEAGSRLRAVGTEPDAGLELTNREMVT